MKLDKVHKWILYERILDVMNYWNKIEEILLKNQTENHNFSLQMLFVV